MKWIVKTECYLVADPDPPGVAWEASEADVVRFSSREEAQAAGERWDLGLGFQVVEVEE